MFLIYTLKNVPSTFGGLAKQILSKLCAFASRVDSSALDRELHVLLCVEPHDGEAGQVKSTRADETCVDGEEESRGREEWRQYLD